MKSFALFIMGFGFAAQAASTQYGYIQCMSGGGSGVTSLSTFSGFVKLAEGSIQSSPQGFGGNVRVLVYQKAQVNNSKCAYTYQGSEQVYNPYTQEWEIKTVIKSRNWNGVKVQEKADTKSLFCGLGSILEIYDDKNAWIQEIFRRENNSTNVILGNSDGWVSDVSCLIDEVK